MNEIERALAKTELRRQRAERYSNKMPEIPVYRDPEVPKEKPKKKDAVFTVNVDLPNGGFSFTFTKSSVYSHTSPNKLTPSEVKRHMMDGLKPLLGGLE